MSSLSLAQISELQSHLEAAVVGCAERGLYQSQKWYLRRTLNTHIIQTNASGLLNYWAPYHPGLAMTSQIPTKMRTQRCPAPLQSSPKIPISLDWKPESTTDSFSPSHFLTAESMTAVPRSFSLIQNLAYQSLPLKQRRQNRDMRIEAKRSCLLLKPNLLPPLSRFPRSVTKPYSYLYMRSISLEKNGKMKKAK